MAEDFYPFVENAPAPDSVGLVRHPARIAVYDDAAAAPRVVVVEPKDVRSYLEEITLQVTQLSQGQGGTIPFMVIREIVENLIHAYFMEPTVSILNHGNTIRFSDQGPGIREKERALQYGTTSATEEMRRYIRGVGSGLPYAQQYMLDKGGSLTIDDNIAGGTIVTISIGDQRRPAQEVSPQQQMATPPQQAPLPQQMSAPMQQMPGSPQQSYGTAPDLPQGYAPQPAYPWPQQPWPPQQGQANPYYPQQQPAYAPYFGQAPQQANPYQAGWGGYGYGYQAPEQQQMPSFGQQLPNQMTQAPYPGTPAPTDKLPIDVTVRGRAIIDYLKDHDSVGPSDLARAYGESQPTWTRELQALEEAGVLRKDGQKRRLTTMGHSLL